MKVYHPLKLKVFCARYHSFHGTAKQGVARYCGESSEVDKEINRGEGFEAVDQGRRKGRRNQCGRRHAA